jgi:pimeloyl-ACP methyl ester carboxylesterase
MGRPLGRILLLFALFFAVPAGAQDSLALHYAPAGEFAVAYRDLGSGDRPLVLVHGWACDHTFWRYQIPFLARQGRVIALDLPGHGWSTKPKVSYTPEVFVEALRAVMDDAGVSQGVLVGHSMGGALCRTFAQRYPHRVAGLVLADPALVRAPADPQKREEFAQMMKGLVTSLTTGPEARDNVRSFIEGMFVPETPEAVRRLVLDKMLGTAPYVRDSAMVNFLHLPTREEGLPTYVPTLALFGAETVRAEGEGLEEDLRRLFPHLTYEVWPGVSHFYMLEAPDRLNDRLAAFAASLP